MKIKNLYSFFTKTTNKNNEQNQYIPHSSEERKIKTHDEDKT